MTGAAQENPPDGAPAVSFVMPCFNEQEALPYTLPRLFEAFANRSIPIEVVAVDNGSHDNTGEVLREYIQRGYPLRVHRVEQNQGYGNGILAGIPLCRGQWTGFVPADGQVDAEDIVRLFEAIRSTDGFVVGKVRRRFRMDGVRRKFVSIVYNGLMFLLWPGLGTLDVNGTPKILRRSVLPIMALESKRWFLDPELMIKARYLKLRVFELNSFARMRGNGLSHVRAETCLEFLKMVGAYRFGGRIRRWRKTIPDNWRERIFTD